MVEWTTKLNTPGRALSALEGVHALTDVTGFGLAGHLLEVCRGSKLGARLRFDAIPVIPEALEWVKQGVATGASERNWSGYGADVSLPAGFDAWKGKLLTDPQTSGGLLVACSAKSVPEVLEIFRKEGFQAAEIGSLQEGPAKISVT
jgi:selenide,water dikinase